MKKEPVANMRECAVLGANTTGAVIWLFNVEARNCKLKSTTSTRTSEGYAGLLAGNVECGQMTQEEWDEKLLAECAFKNYTKNKEANITPSVKVDGGPQAIEYTWRPFLGVRSGLVPYEKLR